MPGDSPVSRGMITWPMAHISGDDRSQLLLLPECVDEYVGADNPVRFIDAFVDGLDMAAAGFERVRPKLTGRPGYDPADLLKLYIYGYLNRVCSSRRLETETHRNLKVIWLLRRLRPDFKTIADFRRTNRAAFRLVFREFVQLCRQLDLYGRELLAVDGTRIKAVNGRDRNFTAAKLERELRRSDERLERYLEQLDCADAADAGSGAPHDPKLAEKIAAIRTRRARLEAHRRQLEASGQDQISLTDPDARAMQAGTGVGVGYNAQIAVDTKHKLIVEQQVHSKVSDLGLLAETAGEARQILGVERVDAVADRGYFAIDDIERCEAAGVIPHVPKPKRSTAGHQGRFPKSRFRYDPATDSYACPGGQRLVPLYAEQTRSECPVTRYANRAACRACALRSHCTGTTFRYSARYANEAILERMAERIAARPELPACRRESVEHPFGTIKHWMGHDRFLMRGLENTRAEFSLAALAYNLRRAINLMGVPALLAAMRC